MNIENKTVLITGAASGIGHALSKLLVQKGGRVFSLDLQSPQAPLAGVIYLSANITQPDDIQKALEKVAKPINVLINNAGVMRRGRLFESCEEDYDLLFDVMVKGSWLVTKLARPYMAKNATLIFMSSRHGFYPKADPALYSLAKQAIINLARLTQKSYSAYKVKLVAPGPIDTPLSRFGVSGEALKEKEKIMKSPAFLAGKIVELLERDLRRLLYNPRTNSYSFE